MCDSACGPRIEQWIEDTKGRPDGLAVKFQRDDDRTRGGCRRGRPTMRRLVLAACMAAAAPAALAQPFDGTVFMSPDVLNAADPSGLRSITYDGRGERRMFDRRVDDLVTVNAYLFTARLAAGDVEFQVNPEFGSQAAARVEVDVFAPALGRLPAVMLSRVDNAWVHAGDELFGGGASGILIHTGYGRAMDRDGYLEEVLFHEAAHASLDQEHADAPGWRTAQQTDRGFVSAYARDNPDREDVAESILPYFAVRFRPERLRPGQRQAIEEAIPARLEYFDAQPFDWSPYMPAVPALPAAAVALLAAVLVAISRRRR